ncbi:LysR substrate-binding domain-containing protein [Caulobacter segnis]|uniref:LysR substrate-binding domain-containing protein n=1 Tax=Caulobacter segnis TaxID=88688 RepID=UPI0028593A6A|nr:LysR substrate-binding domain-containing protein [Caulobacter segnis]MDR6627379.1 LysR family glycine cleavage system transcriptional activator [Caulobacter segnis]
MVRIPPFFALRALEAAARHRSYTRAGEELSVTHGAISQQIRRLESELGARLFERRGGQMSPTPEALRLAQEIGRHVDGLTSAVTAFAAAAERDPLVVSIHNHFASRWLPSRLPALLAHPAGLNLAMRVENRVADFVTDGVDVAIRYGKGDWPGLEQRLLFMETLAPVCSPTFLSRHRIDVAADLLSVPLIHHTHRPWSLWFPRLGLSAPPQTGMVFEDSMMLLDAAARGLGVALARDTVAAPDLISGRLVRPLNDLAPSERGFWVVWRRETRKARRIEALADWLALQAGQSARAFDGPRTTRLDAAPSTVRTAHSR